MPRYSTMRVRALADLARQLRFESARAARRQLGRAEALLLELLEAKASGRIAAAYREAWIVSRITGLRPERAEDEHEDGAIVADALLGDLGALIERLSSAGRITQSELAKAPFGTVEGTGVRRTTSASGEAWMSVDELCGRWGVARKSVERARRLGLASRRVSLGGGRERLVYGRGLVEAFEHAWGIEPAAAGAKRQSRRLTADERGLLAVDGERLRREQGLSTTGAARALAKTHGRAIETIRQALLRAGSTASRTRSRSTSHRRVLELRLAYLRSLDLRWASGPTFGRVDAAEVILAPAHVRIAMRPVGPEPVEDLLSCARRHEAPDEDEERALCAAYGYLLSRARQEIESLRRDRRRFAARLDAVESDLGCAANLKAALVRGQLPIALRSAADRLGAPVTGLGARGGEVLAVVIGALASAIDRFDPFKGGRLAGSASVGVGRAIGAWAKRNEPTGDGRAGRAAARSLGEGAGTIVLAERACAWGGRLGSRATRRRGRAEGGEGGEGP